MLTLRNPFVTGEASPRPISDGPVSPFPNCECHRAPRRILHRIGSFNDRIRMQVVRMQTEVLSPGTYPDPSVGIFSQLFRWTPCRTGRLDAAFVQPDTGSAPARSVQQTAGPGFRAQVLVGLPQAQHGVLANTAHERITLEPHPEDPHWLMRGGRALRCGRNGRGS